MSSQHRGGPARAGFSLVELLVVISIISVLIAVILPAVNSVRRVANATACVATLHQWGAAFQMYLGENRGRPFAFAEQTGARVNPPLWWEHLETYHPETTDTLLCPEATDPANYIPTDAFHAWGPLYLWPEPGRTRTGYVGSYGVNFWLYQSPEAPHKSIRLPHRRADRVPVLFDAADFHVSPLDTDSADFNPDEPIRGGGGFMRFVAMHRHGKGVNVAFADGHADHVNAPELWQLRWSQDFVPRVVTMR